MPADMQFPVIRNVHDVVTFAECNKSIVSYLLSSDCSEFQVGYANQRNFFDYMKMKRNNPDQYQFITQKLKLSDADIVGVQALCVNGLSGVKDVKTKAAKVTFATDYICKLFLNQDV